MSTIATLNENVYKSWINPRVNNLTVDGAFTIAEITVENITIPGTATIGTENVGILTAATSISTPTLSANTATIPIIINSTFTSSGVATIPTINTASLSFGVTPLTYYEIFTIVGGTFSGPWATPVAANVTFEKIGRFVNVYVAGNNTAFAATTSVPATYSSVIPTRFLPLTVGNQTYSFTPVVDNGTAGIGTWAINTSTGAFIIGSGLTPAGSFSGLSTLGNTGWDSFNFGYFTAT
jgi:hypothetical protein